MALQSSHGQVATVDCSLLHDIIDPDLKNAGVELCLVLYDLLMVSPLQVTCLPFDLMLCLAISDILGSTATQSGPQR